MTKAIQNTEWWRDYSEEIQAIAFEHPTLQTAQPELRALSLRERIPAIQLVKGYLLIRPQQEFRCSVCESMVPLEDFATDKCLDCLQDDYLAAAQCAYEQGATAEQMIKAPEIIEAPEKSH